MRFGEIRISRDGTVSFRTLCRLGRGEGNDGVTSGVQVTETRSETKPRRSLTKRRKGLGHDFVAVPRAVTRVASSFRAKREKRKTENCTCHDDFKQFKKKVSVSYGQSVVGMRKWEKKVGWLGWRRNILDEGAPGLPLPLSVPPSRTTPGAFSVSKALQCRSSTPTRAHLNSRSHQRNDPRLLSVTRALPFSRRHVGASRAARQRGRAREPLWDERYVRKAVFCWRQLPCKYALEVNRDRHANRWNPMRLLFPTRSHCEKTIGLFLGPYRWTKLTFHLWVVRNPATASR